MIIIIIIIIIIILVKIILILMTGIRRMPFDRLRRLFDHPSKLMRMEVVVHYKWVTK